VLFNSYEFLLGFLPGVLLLVLGASAIGRHALAKLLLLAASLVFYAWWDPPYVLLLLAFLVFNFWVGSWLIRTAGQGAPQRRRTGVLVLGLCANIAALVYFKYTQFLAAEIGDLLGIDLAVSRIVLPLGISFIVFQKIAFLVDAHGGQIKQLRFLDYALFVSFFPQLISGPIVHHREMIPQFESEHGLRYVRRIVPIAISFVVMGAFKKVVIADHLASHVAIAFQSTAAGQTHDMFSAWLAAVSFALQIYFDFSGYSDMAIGLGLLFGIRLPFNFNSPLKASSIIDFWSRWHMTLTRFLTAYIYNPIVMRATRRRVAARKKVAIRGVLRPGAFVSLLLLPTLFTMFIAGAWHGAGFQFIVFGLIHGAYLSINHAWRNLRRAARGPARRSRRGLVLARALTFLAFVVSIPFFRADSVHSAWRFVASMFGAHGAVRASSFVDLPFLALVGLVLVASQVLPNTQEVMREQLEAAVSPLARHAGHIQPTDPETWSWPRLVWRPTVLYALAIGLLGWIVMLSLAGPSAFLYFQF
jgi:D-alanyl-lipoteichoic acid acyltransferase DltB (MBOAT superfamily)